MLIKQMYNGFTGLIDVGRNVLFVELSNAGTFIDNDKILDKCLMENYIVFIDNDNFNQKEDIIKIIKTINKRNNQIKIWIYCTPINKLASKLENVNYIVMCDGNTNYDKVKDVIIEHYVSYNSLFVFNVATQLDIESVYKIVNLFLIPKKLVYLTTDTDNFKMLQDSAMLNKYNFCLDFKKMLWDE